MQNKIYCSKPETRLTPPCELGIFPETTKGRRTDLEGLKKSTSIWTHSTSICNGPLRDIRQVPNLIKHWYEATVQPRKSVDGFKCFFFYGKAGTGKSTLAQYLASQGGMEPFRYSLRGFWDGYIGQRRVIFDDFRGSDLSYGDFRELSTNSPFELTLNALHVSWRPTNSTSRQFHAG